MVVARERQPGQCATDSTLTAASRRMTTGLERLTVLLLAGPDARKAPPAPLAPLGFHLPPCPPPVRMLSTDAHRGLTASSPETFRATPRTSFEWSADDSPLSGEPHYSAIRARHVRPVCEAAPVTRDNALPDGAYERLLTADLVGRLNGLHVSRQPVEEAETAGRLGQHIGALASRHLAALPHDQRVAAVNRMLAAMDEPDTVAPGPELLTAVARQEAPGVWRLLDTTSAGAAVPAGAADELRTTTPSSAPSCGQSSPPPTASTCCAPSSSGTASASWRRSWPTARRRGIPLRVLTTTYMGATDRTALDRLVRDFGAEVRVNYETQSTRLHAKAWLFRRNSGYDTAYVGCSNLSRAALLDGLEWNVRWPAATRRSCSRSSRRPSTPTGSTSRFVPYDPDTDGERLDEALAIAGGKQHRATGRRSPSPGSRCGLPHQQDHPRPAAGRAGGARPAPQPRRRRHRHRQDRHRGAGLQAAPCRRTRPVAAVRRAPQGDPRAVPPHLPGGAGRRAPSASCTSAANARSAGGTSSPACRACRRTASSRLPAGPVRRRRHRRVPPRRGGDLPAAARPPASRSSCSA